MLKKILKFVSQHKFITTIIILVIVVGGYFGYKTLKGNNQQTRYVLAAVEKGTLIISVSGSGQVSASNQVDIKPKTSGDVISVNVKNGQEVKVGTIIAQIDSSDAQRAVQEAELNLETAKVQLEELLEPADELTILQAENALAKAKEAKQTAEDNIVEGYEDAFNAITDAFFDLPTIMTDLYNILYSYDIADEQLTLAGYWNTSALLNSTKTDYKDELERYIKIAENDYEEVRTKYDENFENYKKTRRYSEQETIEALLEETLETVRTMADAVKSEINMLDFWVDSRKGQRTFGTVTGYQSNLKSYTSKTTNHISSLLSVQRAFKTNRAAVVDAEYSIREKELTLEDLKEGPTDLDIRTKKIVIQQKEAALATVRENLAGCYVRAQFDGVIASLDIEKGDSVSESTTIATVITKQRIAKISLNEVDVAKVKVGQKVNLTFDAVEDLTLTGEVAEVDTVGTTTQGVVTYDVVIVFDTQDERIKPGMSVSAVIITEAKQDVLMISSSAIKSLGEIYYVEVPNEEVSTNSTNKNISLNSAPRQQQVEIGIANDSYTEVVSGLEEGDQIILRTISSSSSSSSSSNASNQSSERGFFIEGGGGPPGR